jgi:hypothetical protein
MGCAAIVLAGCSSGGGTASITGAAAASSVANAPSSTASAPAACLTADQAVAQFVGSRVQGAVLDVEHGYGCSSGWAYINYHRPNGNHSTVALQFLDGRWTIADRVTACGTSASTSAMPMAIYEFGCGN